MNNCINCGSSFVCNPEGKCWCKKMPEYLPETGNEHELCSSCKSNKVHSLFKEDRQLKNSFLAQNEDRSLIHDLVEGVDFTINEDGFLVFSTYYHLRKGYCCGSNCVNCPYGLSKLN